LTPERNPHVVEAETAIRALKPHEISGRLQAVAEAVRRCPAEEWDGLVDFFRRYQEMLQLKGKVIRSNTESLAQRLKPPTQGKEG
jgi:hypothetical protein